MDSKKRETHGDTTDVLLYRDRTRPTRVHANVPRAVAEHLPRGAHLYYDFGPGSDPKRRLELALNILTLFVPPGMDGSDPVLLRSNATSATAHDLHERFAEEFLARMEPSGAAISKNVVRAWLSAAIAAKHRDEVPEELSRPLWEPLDPSGLYPSPPGGGPLGPQPTRFVLKPAQPSPFRPETHTELARLDERGAFYDLYVVLVGDPGEDLGHAIYDHDSNRVGVDRNTGEWEWEDLRAGGVEETVAAMLL